MWIGANKIAAIGVAAQDGVTSHGLALNVDPNLAHFQLITPCGIAGRGVTSMAAILGEPAPLAEALQRSFVEVFSRVFQPYIDPMEEEDIPFWAP